MSTVVVAVDGPAGSGKSSVSRAAAAALGYDFLDTGAAYRAVTWWVLERGAAPEDADAVAALLPDFAYEGAVHPSERWVHVGGRDVTEAIREPRVARRVSAVARVPAVRERLTALFRRGIASADHGIVVEGRDITTVVAPDAQVRVLLTATPEARAARRAAELPHLEHADVAQAMAARDAKDLTVVDFLTAAPGVTELDSTHLDFEGTVAALVAIVRSAEDAVDERMEVVP